MKDKFIGSILFLLVTMGLTLYLAPFIKNLTKNMEGFSGLYDLTVPGSYPKSVDRVILDDFPQIGQNKVSNNNYNQIWWHYPVFKLGSYEQVTNNIRYHYNPDNGTCVRADFCGAVYKNKKDTKSNIITPLPQSEEGSGARVGYFRTEPNELYFSIPTNENILY